MYEHEILHSWMVNAAPWTRAVQSAGIASRALVTDAAITAAVVGLGGRSVLDLGCGEGWLARALGRVGLRATVVGDFHLQNAFGSGAIMRMLHWMLLGVALATAGCVNGRGCLLLEPLKHTLTGRVHFRSYPGPDGMDSVPILALDQTAYVYSPAHSYQCLSATDVQLVGVAEFPDNVGEGSHVSVAGSLFEAVSARQHTGFVMNVSTLQPIKLAP